MLSCDTFVAFPPATSSHLLQKNCVIFGKNSDRPPMEVQEVVFYTAADYPSNAKVQCTYIEIDQVARTHSVILSKPPWMWGAEMGANEHGVCIGNEAVWTKLCDPDKDLNERLLGMDLVRLGLERARTAREGLDVVTTLLETHGQGGPCFEEEGLNEIGYHNSFLIADRTEAWVVETAGQHWAAEHVTNGVRNISNLLTIHTKIDKMSDGLKDHAQKHGYWHPAEGEFDFAKAYHTDTTPFPLEERDLGQYRFNAGKALMEKFSLDGKFDVDAMMQVLRDKEGNICREGISCSTGSQVSLLLPSGETRPDVHWFTATPDPSCSIYKPFVFTPHTDIGKQTASRDYGSEDPVKIIPRFQTSVNREHPLYTAHQVVYQAVLNGESKAQELIAGQRASERQSKENIMKWLTGYNGSNSQEMADVFKISVAAEMEYYQTALVDSTSHSKSKM